MMIWAIGFALCVAVVVHLVAGAEELPWHD